MTSFILNKRREIDKIDSKLIKLLEKRFKIVSQMKFWKNKKRIKIEDKSRERQIKNNYMKSNLPKSFVNGFFDLLFKEVKKS